MMPLLLKHLGSLVRWNDAAPPTVAEAPEFTGSVNAATLPQLKKNLNSGGVNAVEAANEVPEFTGGVNG